MKVSRRICCTACYQSHSNREGWNVDIGRVSALIAATGVVFAPMLAAHADTPAETSRPPMQVAQTEAGTGDSLEEIVITARRRSEVLQDVPQTVNAVSASDLQKLNLQNLQDISGVVPGLQIVSTSAGFNDNNTLRGVTFNPTAGTQNTVAFYLNDIWVTNNFVNTSNFDVGQIEVLRGPQGTLRGEPAPSGSLTIATHRPELEQFGGYATVTAAEYHAFNENAAINLPIIQGKLAVRLAGVADDNRYNDVRSLFNSDPPYDHTYGGRASVRFEPIDAIEANVMYQHIFNHIQSYSQVEGPGAAGGVNANAPANYNGPAIAPFDYHSVQSYPSSNYTTTDVVTGQLDWHVLGQVVSYDGSYWN